MDALEKTIFTNRIEFSGTESGIRIPSEIVNPQTLITLDPWTLETSQFSFESYSLTPPSKPDKSRFVQQFSMNPSVNDFMFIGMPHALGHHYESGLFYRGLNVGAEFPAETKNGWFIDGGKQLELTYFYEKNGGGRLGLRIYRFERTP